MFWQIHSYHIHQSLHLTSTVLTYVLHTSATQNMHFPRSLIEGEAAHFLGKARIKSVAQPAAVSISRSHARSGSTNQKHKRAREQGVFASSGSVGKFVVQNQKVSRNPGVDQWSTLIPLSLSFLRRGDSQKIQTNAKTRKQPTTLTNIFSGGRESIGTTESEIRKAVTCVT